VLLLRRCKLKVIGVDCPTCVYVIKGNLSKLRGFRGFEIDVSSGEAIVEYDDVESSLRDIYMAIRDSGYDVEKKTMVVYSLSYHSIIGKRTSTTLLKLFQEL
jgi:Cu2+-exporting ATPase/Cu+-exporting ATPase